MAKTKDIFQNPQELKDSHPWIKELNLSDAQISEVFKLIARVVAGTDGFDDFQRNLTAFLGADSAFRTAAAAVKNHFWKMKDYFPELEEFQKKLEQKKVSPEPPKASRPIPFINDYYQAADEIISRFGYNEKDERLVNRLRQIIVSRLKDVRDDLETVEVLKNKTTRSGLDFNQELAERLLEIINRKLAEKKISGRALDSGFGSKKKPAILPKEKKRSRRKTLEEKRKEDGGVSLYRPPVRQPERQKPKSLPKTPPKISIGEEDGLPVVSSARSEKKPKSSEKKDNLPPVRPQPYALDGPPPKVSRNRPNLDDLKFQKRLVGPIEELERMTLIDFRRLADNSEKAAGKIREKINLLEKQSYQKRLAGVEAWHKSEVNKFYRLLGQESLSQNKSVEEIIAERRRAGKPTLSLEEFQAVMALNKSLRF